MKTRLARDTAVANFRHDHSRGPILGRLTETGLQWLLLPNEMRTTQEYREDRIGNDWQWPLHAALERFFAGHREDFAGIALDVADETPFRQRVWETSRTIRWGELSSYGDLARRLGRDRGSARAIGQALGANPVPILVPCHRFLAGDGSLGGFTGGLEWKRELLRLEGHSV